MSYKYEIQRMERNDGDLTRILKVTGVVGVAMAGISALMLGILKECKPTTTIHEDQK